MGKLILSAFADEYDKDFETQLKALVEFGIDYLEIRFVNGKNISTLNDTELYEVKKLLLKYGIKINAIGSPLGKIRLDEDTEEHLKLTERICKIANELDAKYIRMFSFYPPAGEKIANHRENVINLLEKMLDIANRYGVILCHENEANIYGESPEACLDLLSCFNGKIKAVFDMGNFALGGYNPLKAYSMLKDYVEYFHIKDGFSNGDIVPPGKGEAAIAEILDAFTNNIRDAFITLEPHLQTFDGLGALTDANIKHSYVYENQQVAFADAVAKLKEIVK
jgi:sugar phosphate isomerase/epimerase